MNVRLTCVSQLCCMWAKEPWEMPDHISYLTSLPQKLIWSLSHYFPSIEINSCVQTFQCVYVCALDCIRRSAANRYINRKAVEVRVYLKNVKYGQISKPSKMCKVKCFVFQVKNVILFFLRSLQFVLIDDRLVWRFLQRNCLIYLWEITNINKRF